MKLKIKKDSRDGSFKGRDGEEVKYFWTKAETEDGITIEFGGKKEYEEGDIIDADIEKTERSGGRFGYKEIE